MPTTSARRSIAAFRDLRLAAKIAVAMSLGVVALGALTVVSTTSLHAATAASDRLLVDASAIRSAQMADMMHDAIHSDVLKILLETDVSAARTDLEDHAALMKASLQEVKDAQVSAAADQAVDAVSPAVDDYISQGLTLADLAGTNPEAAQAQYDDFLSSFKVLEDELPSVGDAIEATSAANQAASQNQRQLTDIIVASTAVGGAIALVLCGWFVSLSTTRPLRKAVTTLEELADGRLDTRLDVASKDEVGQMATALNRAIERLRGAMVEIGVEASRLTDAAQGLSAVSVEMKGTADSSATQAKSVSTAAEDVSANVSLVAAGTEQMSASIREIALSTADASGIASQAVEIADSARSTVAALGDSSTQIGNVVKTITSIAEQTNLLALNATIEAARAGDAGKGFAVVAGEVKDLARETSLATDDIGKRIEAIQQDAEAAVGAIMEISRIVEQINQGQASIAAAIEEQTATTNEMGRSVAEAASGSTHIASTITSLAQSASGTTAAAGRTSSAADDLLGMAADLKRLVGQFHT